MHAEMTTISKDLYSTAVSDIFTIQDAVRYLEKEAKIRSLREKLEKFSHGRELRKILVQGLLENDPQRKKEATERRVRSWLSDNGKVSSMKKQDAIEVCFILQLSIEEADQLVAMISEESLHYRNPEEIVFIFALQHGMSYQEAVGLKREIEGRLAKLPEETEIVEDSFTPVIRKEISNLRDKGELEEYLKHAAGRLGRFHNCAYQEFRNRIKLLEKPEPEKQEKGLKIRDILREYLFENNVLYAKERVRATKQAELLPEEEKMVFTKVQESISASWPDEVTLSRMKTRKTDVTRKVLILLFLATDPGKDWSGETSGYWAGLEEEQEPSADAQTDPEYLYEDMDEELTREEAFEDIYVRLNHMLALCGFAQLDPRSPFDWLILYCICRGDMFEADVRMREIFREMFGQREEAEKAESGN